MLRSACMILYASRLQALLGVGKNVLVLAKDFRPVHKNRSISQMQERNITATVPAVLMPESFGMHRARSRLESHLKSLSKLQALRLSFGS